MSCAVLSRIVQLSEPVSLADTAWDFLGTSPNVRRYPGDWQSLLATLEEEFSIDDLISANVMLKNGAEDPEPSPMLSELTRAFVCLVREKDKRHYDLVTDRGSMMRDEPPCFTACDDWYTNACTDNKHARLFVVPRVRSLAVLRRLKLPASVASGLSEVDGNQMRLLCGPPGFDRHGTYENITSMAQAYLRRTTIVLVAWDVTGLHAQDLGNVKASAVRLARIAETFEFEMNNVRLWIPTPTEVRKIALAAELRDVRLVHTAIHTSLKKTLYELRDYIAEERRPKECGEARGEVASAIERARKLQFQTAELTERRDHCTRLFDQTFVQPLYAAAESTEDDAARPLLRAAAEIAEQLHEGDPLLRVAAHAGSPNDNPQSDALTPEESKERRQLVAQLISIRRELRGKKH